MDATTSQDGQPRPILESSAQAREGYAKAKQELIEALSRKRALDKQLMQCEIQIYNYEASYLAETAAAGGGNIIHGFEGYLKSQGMNKRRTEVSDADRIFSNSSSTYSKSLELQGEDSDTPGAETPGKFSNPGLQTVMLPPATRQQELQSAAQQKKERDRLYQRQKRARNLKERATTSGDENDYLATGSNNNRRKRPKIADDE